MIVFAFCYALTITPPDCVITTRMASLEHCRQMVAEANHNLTAGATGRFACLRRKPSLETIE